MQGLKTSEVSTYTEQQKGTVLSEKHVNSVNRYNPMVPMVISNSAVKGYRCKLLF